MSRGFDRFRRAVWVFALVIVLITGTAHAANIGALWGPFDLVDSKGIRLSQYQMSMDDGTGLTKPNAAKGMYYWVISILWAGYTSFIGIVAWVLDWTVSLEWVRWIAAPLVSVEEILRRQLLIPLGAQQFGGAVMGLLMTVGGAIGGWKVWRGGAAGWIDMLWSAVAGALAVGVFSAPVVMVVGDGQTLSGPMLTARQAGLSITSMISTGKAPTESMTHNPTMDDTVGDKETGKTAASKMLLDTFVRPVHQQLNYGKVLDTEDTKCAKTYDDLLKAGPYGGSAKEVRKGMGKCNKEYLQFADAASSANWMFGFMPYQVAMALLSVMIIIFTGLMWMAVIAVAWSALSLLFNVILAIVPGPSRNGLLRDLVSIAFNLLYVVLNMGAIAIVLKIVEEALLKPKGPLPLKFLVVDAILLTGIGFLIWVKIKASKGEKSWVKTLTEKISGKAANPTRVEKTKEMIGGAASSAAGARVSQMVKSNPGKALAAGAAGMATGGAGTAVMVAKASNTAQIASAVNGMRQTYNRAREGDREATTGNRVGDAVMWSTTRAHNHVVAQVQAARAIHENARYEEGVSRATTGSAVIDRVAEATGESAKHVDQTRERAAQGLATASQPLVKGVNQARTAMSERVLEPVREKVVNPVRTKILQPAAAMTRPPEPAPTLRAETVTTGPQMRTEKVTTGPQMRTSPKQDRPKSLPSVPAPDRPSKPPRMPARPAVLDPKAPQLLVRW